MEAMENELIPESTQASDDEALLLFGKHPNTCIAHAMLGATADECIRISATALNDGACNHEFVIHYERTTDLAHVLEWTTTRPRPSNNLWYYARRSLWTKILQEAPMPPFESL